MMTTRRSSPRTRRISNDNFLESEDTSATPNPKAPSTVPSRRSKDEKNIVITPSSEVEGVVNDLVVPSEADEATSSSAAKTSYQFNGVNYISYLDMVNAKRQRNQEVLEQSGLLTLVQQRRKNASVSKSKSKATLLGIKAKRNDAVLAEEASKRPRRTSSRLQGVAADGRYVEDERAGKVTVAHVTSDAVMVTSMVATPSAAASQGEDPYRRRLKDGITIAIPEAMEFAGTKWMTEHSVRNAESFLRNTLVTKGDAAPNETKEDAMHDFDHDLLEGLECNDADRNVAKVCPDRIYSMAVHPSWNDLIVCAGDKSGHVGIWNTAAGGEKDTSSEENENSVHLFKPHSGAVCALQWTGASSQSCSNLMTASYDGTVRLLDVEQETFLPLFSTYNDDAQYSHRPGYGLEQYGHKFWTQFICLDPRWNHQDCFFLSTSIGTAMHIDLRIKEPITFHEDLSEKKINTLSLHPNGYSMISAGLDCTVALWDVRTLGSKDGTVSPIASYNGGRSVNSAFFSPSGRYVVSTTMANKLDLFEDLHLASASSDPMTPSKKKPKGSSMGPLKPYKSITHDNMTGRWLTTFQAIFHPQWDVFAVGSMRQPRCVELFDPAPTGSQPHLLRTVTGDALTAVASRLAFHPRTDQLIVVGGNSSGRATIVRKS